MKLPFLSKKIKKTSKNDYVIFFNNRILKLWYIFLFEKLNLAYLKNIHYKVEKINKK